MNSFLLYPRCNDLYLDSLLELYYKRELGEYGQVSLLGHRQLRRLHPHCGESQNQTRW